MTVDEYFQRIVKAVVAGCFKEKFKHFLEALKETTLIFCQPVFEHGISL
jgi:hypothetical protein